LHLALFEQPEKDDFFSSRLEIQSLHQGTIIRKGDTAPDQSRVGPEHILEPLSPLHLISLPNSLELGEREMEDHCIAALQHPFR
jgi:hypothetical protein